MDNITELLIEAQKVCPTLLMPKVGDEYIASVSLRFLCKSKHRTIMINLLKSIIATKETHTEEEILDSILEEDK